MFRQVSSFSRFHSSCISGQQRKLILVVFLWFLVCLVLYKSALLSQPSEDELSSDISYEYNSDERPVRSDSLRTKSWVSEPSAAQLYLSHQFALPDNSNTNGLYYNLMSYSDRDFHRNEKETVVVIPTNVITAAQTTTSKSANKIERTIASHTHENHQSSSSHLQVDAAKDQGYEGECRYKYPNLVDLQFNNIHWQRMTTHPTRSGDSSRQTSPDDKANFTSYYLYNAYYDDRWRQGTPSVRILSMIDSIKPPPTNCLLWFSAPSASGGQDHQPAKKIMNDPLITRATFVYVWYPKWGNYKNGILQPWIVTCPLPHSEKPDNYRAPDSVSLVQVPSEIEEVIVDSDGDDSDVGTRSKRDATQSDPSQQQQVASIAMPPSFSSSLPSVSSSPQQQSPAGSATGPSIARKRKLDCQKTLPITNNLPVYNHRPKQKQKFGVCVKGLDFPKEDLSIRLVEWIELLNLLGAGKIFLYSLNVHENISKVLHYYQQRGIVDLSPITLPGDQPNSPDYQHLYLKSKLTAKRQNELIPYNDCLYKNLNSFQYLILLDIDEIIMPLKNHNWLDLMDQVESLSSSEQNYTRASYNVRNVYFFDDLVGPSVRGGLSSSSASPGGEEYESPSENDDGTNGFGGWGSDGIPNYLHMMRHVYRSKNYTKPGQYVKCFHNTDRVVSLHNHFPLNCFGQCTTYSIPVELAHLQHYRKDCVGPLKKSCKNDFRVFKTRDTTIWKYKQQMIKRTTRVLNLLGLLDGGGYGDSQSPLSPPPSISPPPISVMA